jgi:cellulose synthase/poly-beta-1,6-N-acetylglucosamine synthase-like glycosyltransferase
MNPVIEVILKAAAVFFLIYLLLYASYLFLSVAVGAWRLYHLDKMRSIKNELKHDFYFPVSILVPAYNEEVTILDSVESLLNLDYRLYEIVVVDDGSKDNTSQVLIDHFHMHKVSRPIRISVPCKPIEAVYEAPGTRVRLTLIRKHNGGKANDPERGDQRLPFSVFYLHRPDSMFSRIPWRGSISRRWRTTKIVAVGA